ncbi:hypothetical protein [Raineyella fluvialis]|uniref:Uncharacterized protein n=1 Tax=Raineyella fluvialis TaxID=2662261 RepID=A0A5Q2F7A1_9ACTN|nr:hypothetical protein [Raineyella fluvialis]QGF22870.1 hypothetical protein Rai3103_03395 [Raineyella fluvialis]
MDEDDEIEPWEADDDLDDAGSYGDEDVELDVAPRRGRDCSIRRLTMRPLTMHR